MNDKVKEWASKNWFLFIILAPILLAYLFRDVIISLLIDDSKKIANDAATKDQDLSKKEADYKAQADEQLKKAQALENSTPKVDENWYKK